MNVALRDIRFTVKFTPHWHDLPHPLRYSVVLVFTLDEPDSSVQQLLVEATNRGRSLWKPLAGFQGKVRIAGIDSRERRWIPKYVALRDRSHLPSQPIAPLRRCHEMPQGRSILSGHQARVAPE